MKIALAMIFSLILYPLLGTAQNTARFKTIKVLWIIKTDNGVVKSHNFLVDEDDVEKLYIPTKPQASKDLGEIISEDLVVYVTLKKM